MNHCIKMPTCLLFFILLCSTSLTEAAVPPLPEPVANNAVAQVETKDGTWLISFMGLGAGKDWQDVHNKVWAINLSKNAKLAENSQPKWEKRTPVPSSLPLKGRLAAIAVGLNGQAWLFGGYTVAEDHSEISSPDNFAYDVLKDEYSVLSPMPVPVDDAVALIYQNRYIYLISGWHNDGNVNLTQVYDTKTDSWSQASPFLGKPVFGQAGGIVGNRLLICDGVKVVPLPDKRRTFAAENACYSGIINPDNHLKIDWRTVPHPTGTARYRMAAKGIRWNGKSGVLFIGGSDNPYNYNGIGYNGVPANPDDKIWYYDFDQTSWKITTYNANPKRKATDSIATMDHRGLLETRDGFLIIAGMSEGQKVLDQITFFDKSKLLTSITKD